MTTQITMGPDGVPAVTLVDAPFDMQPPDAEPEPEQPPEPPKPKPGDADYDWAQHYGTTKLFHHTFPDGKVVALKTFGAIFSKTWLYKIRNLKTNVDIEIAAIDRATCDEAKQVIEELDDSTDVDHVDDLWKAWSGADTKDGGDEGLTAGN